MISKAKTLYIGLCSVCGERVIEMELVDPVKDREVAQISGVCPVCDQKSKLSVIGSVI